MSRNATPHYQNYNQDSPQTSNTTTTTPTMEKTRSASQNGHNLGAQQSPQGVRQRAQPSMRSSTRRTRQVSGRLEGYGSEDEDMDSEAERDLRHHHKRREIRQKLHHKPKAVRRIQHPWTKWMHSESKNHFVAFMGEFVGTFMFFFFAFAGTQVANIGSGNSTNQSTTGSATGFNPATLLYISFSFGFSLIVNAWIFYRISGGLFNPAVTLALALLGEISFLRAVLQFIAQITGGTFSAYVVSVLFPTVFNVRTTLAVGTSKAQGVFIEAICTAELVFTILMLAAEKHRATFIAPLGIGFSLFISELVAVYYTGGSLNPARSFAPCAVTQFDADHWIYWVGPLIGSLLATGFYKLNKLLEYEMVNPGQDGDEENDPTQNPDHEVRQAAEERAIEVEEIREFEENQGQSAFDPDMREADVAMDLDGHEGAETTKINAGHKEDVEAQWPSHS